MHIDQWLRFHLLLVEIVWLHAWLNLGLQPSCSCCDEMWQAERGLHTDPAVVRKTNVWFLTPIISFPLSASVNECRQGRAINERGQKGVDLQAVDMHLFYFHTQMCSWWVLEPGRSKNMITASVRQIIDISKCVPVTNGKFRRNLVCLFSSDLRLPLTAEFFFPFLFSKDILNYFCFESGWHDVFLYSFKMLQFLFSPVFIT